MFQSGDSGVTTTVKIQEWTKGQLNAIKDDKDHPTYNSVIISLLKDREYHLSAEEGSNTGLNSTDGETQ